VYKDSVYDVVSITIDFFHPRKGMLHETQDNNFTVAHAKRQLKVMVINKNALT